MGKTKTVTISGSEEEKKSSLDKLKEKRERQKKEAEAKGKGEEKKVRAPGLKGGERIRVVEGVEVGTPFPEKDKAETKETGAPKVRGKKYRQAKDLVDKEKLYSLKEAVGLAKETSFSKFDATLELHLVLNKKKLKVDVTLPHSTGKVKRIELANEKTVEKLKLGKIDFDLLLATPEMMPKLVPFAKLLGPRGLMPNPKNKTVIKNEKEAEKFKGGGLTLKTQKDAPLVHVVIGKVSQKETEVSGNIEAIFKAVGVKTIEKAYLTSTMGPSIKVSFT